LFRHHDDDGADYWDWETVSHFAPKLNTGNKTNISHSDETDTEDICDNFPSHLLSRIQVVLKIGSSEPRDRLDTHIATVTRCISNLIIVSDRESEFKGHHIHDVLATYPPSFWVNVSDYEAYEDLRFNNGKAVDGNKGWNLDRFKFLPMLEHAYRINPTAEWFIFLETDTYVFWDNIYRLLDHYHSEAPSYFGSPAPGRADGNRRTFFAYGGSGFILSASAIEKLLIRKFGSYGQYEQPSLAMQFADLIRDDCCGDSVLGWVLHQKGVALSGLWPMFNAHALHGIPFNDVHWCQPVISLHKTQLRDMKALAKFEYQRDRTVSSSVMQPTRELICHRIHSCTVIYWTSCNWVRLRKRKIGIMVTGAVSKSLRNLLHTPRLMLAEMLVTTTRIVSHTPIALINTVSLCVP
jgi:hypothetical protein